MAFAQAFDAAGRGFNIREGAGTLGSDVEETFIDERPLGAGYFAVETSLSGSPFADTAFYLVRLDSTTGQVVYEQIEAYLDRQLTLQITGASVTELDVIRFGIEAFLSGNDTVIGNSFDDKISGFGGNDLLQGLTGNDAITGNAGNDFLDGGAGQDTAIYSGNQNSYSLTLSPSSVQLADRRSDSNGTDTLVDVEFLDFGTDLLGSPFDLTNFGGLSG
ncbi:calcium-binding protein, partial [Sulfitobacter geojensis]|uniref:calcium-binding protein n=1 Tax=Sulfitobacter geojensis TaxID=1342299 RepID=UPI003CD0D446